MDAHGQNTLASHPIAQIRKLLTYKRLIYIPQTDQANLRYQFNLMMVTRGKWDGNALEEQDHETDETATIGTLAASNQTDPQDPPLPSQPRGVNQIPVLAVIQVLTIEPYRPSNKSAAPFGARALSLMNTCVRYGTHLRLETHNEYEMVTRACYARLGCGSKVGRPHRL